MRLKAAFAPAFSRDLKKLKRKQLDRTELQHVIDLVLQNTPEARDELRRRHRMHALRGAWEGSNECHVANAGDWIVVWRENDNVAFFQRTGTHEEIFR